MTAAIPMTESHVEQVAERVTAHIAKHVELARKLTFEELSFWVTTLFTEIAVALGYIPCFVAGAIARACAGIVDGFITGCRDGWNAGFNNGAPFRLLEG